MSTPANLPLDGLAVLINADTQKIAARMAQDIFTGVFRHTVSADPDTLGQKMSEVERQCVNWCQAGNTPDAHAARLALLISGLDQWGLAYSQAFNLTALPALSALLGSLRNRLDLAADARFQWYFSQIETIEGDAIDFKIELRRSIHLALWHAMTACQTEAEAQAILQALGGLLLGLQQHMPTLGWRLLADALASIQLALLNAPAASRLAEKSTEQLFAALRQALPAECYRDILAHAGQAVLAWQQAKRAPAKPL